MKKTLFAVSILCLSVGCEDPNKDVPAAKVTEASEKAVEETKEMAPNANMRSAEIDLSKSKVEFVGAKITGSHTGEFKTFSGKISYSDTDLSSGSVTINIVTDSVETDFGGMLTDHIKSDEFFDVAKFPEAKFESSSLTKKEGSTYEVKGNLSLHGVTKEITFPATIAIAGGKVTAKAEFKINRKDFKIEYPGKPNDLIKDDVVIKFNVVTK